MIIIVNDVTIVNGMEGDNYNVGNTSATTLIAQCEEDRLAIEQFISQHVPTIDEDVMEAVWPAKSQEGRTMSGDTPNDAFVQEMEMRISNLNNVGSYEKSEYSEGQKSGFEYALAVYRDIVKHDTVDED